MVTVGDTPGVHPRAAAPRSWVRWSGGGQVGSGGGQVRSGGGQGVTCGLADGGGLRRRRVHAVTPAHAHG